MRVITGQAKGKKLKAPKGLTTRPTTDRVKEALFNILNLYIEDSQVLDLFAGSGSIGIEALSRGAKKSFFVDKSSEAIKCINDNLHHTNLISKAEVYRNDVFNALLLLGRKKEKFDIIFIDPPYLQGFEINVLEKIKEYSLLYHDGIIIIEISKKDIIPEIITDFYCERSENYGDTTLLFYTSVKSDGQNKGEN